MDVLAILCIPIGALMYWGCVRPTLIDISASPRSFWVMAVAAVLATGAAAMLGALAIWDQATGERAYSLVYWPLRGVGLSSLSVLLLGWSLPELMAAALGGRDPSIPGRAAVDELIGSWRTVRGDAGSERRWLEDLAQALAASGRGQFALDPDGPVRRALGAADGPGAASSRSAAVAEVLRQFRPFDPVSWYRARSLDL